MSVRKKAVYRFADEVMPAVGLSNASQREPRLRRLRRRWGTQGFAGSVGTESQHSRPVVLPLPRTVCAFHLCLRVCLGRVCRVHTSAYLSGGVCLLSVCRATAVVVTVVAGLVARVSASWFGYTERSHRDSRVWAFTAPTAAGLVRVLMRLRAIVSSPSATAPLRVALNATEPVHAWLTPDQLRTVFLATSVQVVSATVWRDWCAQPGVCRHSRSRRVHVRGVIVHRCDVLRSIDM